MKARGLIAVLLLSLAAGLRGQDIEPARVIVGSGYIPYFEEAEPRPTPHFYVAKMPAKKKVVRKANKARATVVR